MILMDARYVKMSGIGTYVKNFIEGYLTSDRSVVISFLFSKKFNSPFMGKCLSAGCVVYECESDVFELLEQVEISKLLRRVKPQWFFVPHFNVPFWVSRRTNIACVIHDNSLDIYPKDFKNFLHLVYYKIIMRRAIRSTVVFTDSKYSQEILSAFYHIGSHVVYPGFSPPTHRFPNVDSRKKNSFLYVGVNKIRKNIRLLIDVMELLPKDYELNIIGNMESDQYDVYKDICNRGLQNRVFIHGYVSKEVLESFYLTSTALLFPSILEGFGYPLLEAASYGLPVICSGTTSLPEVGGNGCIYFDPDDISDFCHKVKTFMAGGYCSDDLIAKNHLRISEFTPAIHFNGIIDILRDDNI